RGPDPVQHPRSIRTVRRPSIEQRVAPGDASTPVEILHRPLLRRVDSGRREGLLLDAVHRGLNRPGKRIAGERRAGLDAGAVLEELRLLGGVRPRRDHERAGVGDRAGDPERHRSVCPDLFRTHSAQPDEAGWGTSIIAILVAPGTPAAEYAFARRRQIGLDLAEY